MQKNKMMDRLSDFLIMLFFFSFIFGIRFLVGLATILLVANALVTYRLQSGRWWNPAVFNLFITGLCLFFAMQAIALLYTRNLREGMSIFQTNLGMIVLPVAASYSRMINHRTFRRWMKGCLVILLAATVLALILALSDFLRHHDSGVFFYHSLVSHYSNHAVQFSVIVFTAILFLAEEYPGAYSRKKKTLILSQLIYFSIFLFLLSSKLVIVLYFIYMLYMVALTNTFVHRLRDRLAGFFILAAIIAGLFIINTPFSHRMRVEANAHISLIRQEKFDPGDYFTGVQFRLLSWRFVDEILNEKHAWILGVSPGDSQDALAEKYVKENMFAGGIPGNEKGYLAYHSHNQFLQAVLETGLVGLVFFMTACGGLIRMAWKSASRPLGVLVILLLCNCFTDAPLKTQYGIILFVFFPLFIYKGTGQTIQNA